MTASRYFYRAAGYPQAPGSPFFDDVEEAVKAAIRLARLHGESQTVFEAGSKPYPVAVRDIDARKAKALGAWTDRDEGQEPRSRHANRDTYKRP